MFILYKFTYGCNKTKSKLQSCFLKNESLYLWLSHSLVPRKCPAGSREAIGDAQHLCGPFYQSTICQKERKSDSQITGGALDVISCAARRIFLFMQEERGTGDVTFGNSPALYESYKSRL